MSQYSDAFDNTANSLQNIVDRQRKNAAYHALAQAYGPTAGDPDLAAKLQNNAFAGQIDPLKVQAQQLENTGTQQTNTDNAQAAQRKNAYMLTQLLGTTAANPDGSIDSQKYDQLVGNPAVQQLTGISPDQAQQLKPLLTAPGGSQHLEQIGQSLLGPQKTVGAPAYGVDAQGNPVAIINTASGTITRPLNGVTPTSVANSQSGIANHSSEIQNRAILPNGQVNQPYVNAKAQIEAAAAKAGVSLSPEAISMFADEAARTGKIQSFGMGGKATVAAIGNKMAANGVTGDQLVSGAQDYKSRQAYVTDLAKSSPTSAGGLSRSAGAVLAHIDTLDQMIDAMGNKNIRLVNYLQQKYKQETGKPLPVTFDAQKVIVGDELTRYLIARGGTLHDRQQMQDSLSRANSPAQLKGVINTYKDDIGAQLYSQYAQAKGFNADKQFLGNLTPYAREILTGVEDPNNHPTAGQMNSAQPKGQLPGGFTYLGAVKQ